MSYKKIVCILFVVGIFWVSGQAQEGAIYGTVYYYLDSIPLPDVKVIIRNSGGGFTDSLITESDGKYVFDSLEIQGSNEIYDVIASHVHYQSDTQSVRLTNNSPVDTADFTLVPKTILIPVPSPTTNLRPTLKWIRYSATNYTIQIDTNDSFNNPVISTPVDDTTYTPLVDLPIATIYWRVAVLPPVYSDIGSFVITDPYTPVIIPYSPDPTSNKKPTLLWNSVTGASSYQILIDDNGDFSSILISTPLADTFYTPLVDLPVGTIYWKVKSDLSSNYSFPDTFDILSEYSPLLYTFDGATVPNWRPVFKWHPVVMDTVSITYTINIDSVINFTSPVISTPVGDTVYTPLIDLNIGEKYYWRVSSSLDPSLFSPIDSLIIDSVTSVLSPHLNKAEIHNIYIHPNPFINATKISYILPKTTMFTVAIFSMDGALVRNLCGKNTAGQHFVAWDGMDNKGRDVGAGVYLLRFTAGKVLNRRLILIR